MPTVITNFVNTGSTPDPYPQFMKRMLKTNSTPDSPSPDKPFNKISMPYSDDSTKCPRCQRTISLSVDECPFCQLKLTPIEKKKEQEVNIDVALDKLRKITDINDKLANLKEARIKLDSLIDEFEKMRKDLV